MKEFLFGTRGDMVERGLIMVAIVVAAIFLWVSIGQAGGQAGHRGRVVGSVRWAKVQAKVRQARRMRSREPAPP